MAQENGSSVEISDDVKNMKFEEALAALENIVRSLENGDVSLEQSIEIYTRGTELKAHCEDKLKDATARIEKITKSGDGVLESIPFDDET